MKSFASSLLFSLLPFGFQSLEAQDYMAPAELKINVYSDHKVTPTPACLSASADGKLFVGVDGRGSLGKGPGKGKIIQLIDDNHDGVADRHTVYATLDNPRGLMSVGDKLYVLYTKWKSAKEFTGMYLGVLEDKDQDGVADGPPKVLVSNISCKRHNQRRGADHTTNGIRMGIDGWIYIAIGDFGMVGAKGTDGRTLDMLGGGIIRVRPDGTEMETYVHGLRNIYDIAIDPLMNVYTWGNTNDGGGWNIRFIHEIQSGQYGYPILFKRFTNEILPALVDAGGGSGTGSMFFQEPGWPDKYNNLPLMGDWGRSQVIIVRLKEDGASFQQTNETYLNVKKFTDIDVDGTGQMYVSSWGKAGFSGGNSGSVGRVVPKDWTYKAFPNLKQESLEKLISYLQTDSATWRLHASQEIIRRDDKTAAMGLLALIQNQEQSRESRVAAIFTYKQLLGKDSSAALLKASADAKIREHCLRAVGDREGEVAGVPLQTFLAALNDKDPRVQVAAAVALGRLNNKESVPALLAKTTGLHIPMPNMSKQDDGLLFQSKNIKGREQVTIDVDISGEKDFYLIVGDGGNGNSSDHGSFFEPVLIDKNGHKTKLTDLKWKSAKQGWGTTNINKDCTKAPLKTQSGEVVEFGIGTHAPAQIHYRLPKGKYVRFQSKAGNSSKGSGLIQFKLSTKAQNKVKAEGPHSTPNASVILPHVARKALQNLNAIEGCLQALGGNSEDAALSVLRTMHDPKVSHGLIAKMKQADTKLKLKIIEALSRLYHREEPYDGSWWWGTRPDTRGPYYKLGLWEGSKPIKQAVLEAWNQAEEKDKKTIAYMLEYNRVQWKEIGSEVKSKPKKKQVQKELDLAALQNKQGQVGKMSVENVIIALGKIKGNKKHGEKVFNTQGCIACHSYKSNQVPKGPNMGAIGNILSREEIAMAILRPNNGISQGFHSVQIETKDKNTYHGFITKEQDGVVELRTITGKVHQIKEGKIKARKTLPQSMMPPGLANGLSLKDFASMIDWLKSNKG